MYSYYLSSPCYKKELEELEDLLEGKMRGTHIHTELLVKLVEFLNILAELE